MWHRPGVLFAIGLVAKWVHVSSGLPRTPQKTDQLLNLHSVKGLLSRGRSRLEVLGEGSERGNLFYAQTTQVYVTSSQDH